MKATVVTDLGYGDAGKGSVVDWLARTRGARLVVRHNGGPQAAHNVVTSSGQHHTFHQFGAGALVGAPTHLSRFMRVDPLELAKEAAALAALGVADPWAMLTADRAALVVAPYQRAANRLRELARGPGAHGTCGAGVGEAVSDSLEHPDLALRIADLARPRVALRKLEALRELKRAQLADAVDGLRGNPRAVPELRTLDDPGLSMTVVEFYSWLSGVLRVVDGNYLGSAMAAAGHTVFEGAHGVLLDERFGFHPHTTWSTCTPENAFRLLADADFSGEVVSLGLVRAYATRHGAGPLVTEDAKLSARLPDAHNGGGGWQGAFRAGWFDAVAARYAVAVSGDGMVDELVVTCADRLYGEVDVPVCTGYRFHGYPGGPMRRITPPPVSSDLDCQATLTADMFAAEPCYSVPVPGVFGPDTVRSYCQSIGDMVGLPVGLVSLGPTAEDKVLPAGLPA